MSSKSESKTIILTRFKIDSLFGIFNYDLHFYTHKGITILHGINGTGKTIILNLIRNLNRGDFVRILDVNFDTIIFWFENTSSNDTFNISLKRLTSNELKITINHDENKSDVYKRHSFSNFEVYRNILHQSSLDHTANKNSSKNNAILSIIKELESQLRDFHCVLLSAHRLLIEIDKTERSEECLDLISRKSKHLLDMMSELERNYTKISQKQDKDLVKRILHSFESHKEYLSEKIAEEFEKIEEKYEEYSCVGFLTSKKDIDFDIRFSLEKSKKWKSNEKKQSLLRILSEVIIRDNKNKLQIFDSLYKRISLFRKIVNYLLDKKQ
jgi:hypothetical protein